MRGQGYDAAPGVAYGEFRNVGLALTSATCTADLTGLLRWHLDNGDRYLTITAPRTLTAANVAGCGQAISDGDTFTFNAEDVMNRHEVITGP